MIIDLVNKILNLESICVHFSKEEYVYAKCCNIIKNGNETIRTYDIHGDNRCEIRSISDGDNIIFFADISVDSQLYRYRGVSFKLDFECLDNVLAFYHHNPIDIYHNYPKTSKDLKKETQFILAKKDNSNYSFLQLCGDNFRCEADDGELYLDSRFESKKYHGAFLVVSSAELPYDAIEKSYDFAYKNKALITPLRKEKKLNDVFKGIGYCTWNAYYKNVNSKDVYQKLDEFKEKGIKIDWLLIDDGWLNERNEALLTFEANPEKFPEGLKKCITKIKTEYGIKYVGLWHTFQGHWSGIDPNGEIYKNYSECFMIAQNGCYVPSADEEKAFRFWDAFHSFLALCGVDFVKTDNQSSLYKYIEGIMPTTEYARTAHKALERSIEKNFNGALINCMGMDMEEMQNRPISSLTRNSDDFWPDKEDGFGFHVMQNVFNTVVFSPLFWCDFDMFWSGKSDPVRSGILRAISGATIYMSDELTTSNIDNILPICGNEWSYRMFESAAMPTIDILYEDIEATGRLVKTYNYIDNDYSMAIFNLSNEIKTEKISLCDISSVKNECEYIAFEYFNKLFFRLKSNEKFEHSLNSNEVAAYSFMPILSDENGEYIELGDISMYFPPMSIKKDKIYLIDLLK